MKIFISSLPVNLLTRFNSLQPQTALNVLLTFYDLNKPTLYTDIHRSKIGKLILDCGAFSINNLQVDEETKDHERELLYQKYRIYAPAAQDRYDFIFSMDDRFDLDSFDHNLARLHDLEEAGVEAVPVIHNIHDRYEIDYFMDRGYKTIAIGQCKGRDNLKILWPVVDKLYSNGVRVHLFGMTTPNIISHVPAYSCDSKTWLDYGVRGRVLYWNPENPGLDKTDLIYFPKYQDGQAGPGQFHCHEYPFMTAFKEHIGSKLDLELSDLKGLEAEFNRKLVNILYFVELEEHINSQAPMI